VNRLLNFLDNRPVPLWLLVSLSFVGYLILSFWFPLRPYFNVSPSLDIRSLAPSLAAGLAYVVLICLLYALYLLAYRLISTREDGLSLLSILLVAAAFCLPLLLTYPINATDIYRYFIQGRISAVYNENPFTLPPSALEGDPYAPLAGEWADFTTPYGPIWELAAGTLTRVAPGDLWTSMLLFKGLAALAFLAGAMMIWLSLSRSNTSNRAGATVLWAWNPTLLLIFAMDGHNDSLMILWLLSGWWLVDRGRFQVGMILMLLAPLTKAIGLLPLPFFFLGVWRRLPDVAARIRFLIVTLIAGLALLTLSFLPFGSPLDLAARLLEEAGGGLGFSPITLLVLIGNQLLDIVPSLNLLSRISALLFGLFAFWLFWQTWRGRSPLRSAADIFFGYVLQALSFRIWYASWPFPWLILDREQPDRRNSIGTARLGAGLAFLFTSQLSVIIYGQIRVALLGGTSFASHLVAVPFTFLLPLAVGLYIKSYLAKKNAGPSD
jgi:alpha-1,6-mannosyltransferase